MDSNPGKRVCVIGAGIAGLVTAKVMKEDGFDVTMFEKDPEFGGVWAASRTYPGLRANNPRETYAFSDFPYPETADDFPTAEQVRSYLNAYADHSGLRPLIRLSTEVLSVKSPATRPGAARTFEIAVRTRGSETVETLHFDFVAVCNGVFHEPYVPRIDGQELFIGPILHSSRLTDPGLVAGKRVVVVGAGKSALDCAAWAAEHGRSCTLVFTSPHWMVPRYFFGRIRIDRIIMTRFSELFLHYHRQGRFEAFLHGPLKILITAWWHAYSFFLRRMLKMPAALTPDTPLPQGFEYVGVGDDLYSALDRGKLVLKRARIARFTGASAIELDTGEVNEADVVVFATGWRQAFPFLDPALLNQVMKNGRLHLYRHILPPERPHLGFIGYASSTACQLTSEIAAHWLSQCFRGELALGSVAAMEQEISRVLKWTSEVFPSRSEGYYIGPYVAHYLDELLLDMGLPRKRTNSFFSEYFSPNWPERYKNVGEQRRKARKEETIPDV